MGLFESSQNILNRGRTEEILLFDNIFLHFFRLNFREEHVLVEKDTRDTFSTLSSLDKIYIIVISLAMMHLVPSFKRWKCTPEAETICVKCIIARYRSVIGHCFDVLTSWPNCLFSRYPINFNSFFLYFPVKLNLIYYVVSLNLPWDPLRVTKIRNFNLLS